jgi:hypothetical protein
MRYQKPGHYVVPGVVGDSLEEAKTRIDSAGLPWSVRATALPPTVTKNLYKSYCVGSQEPAAGVGVTVDAAASRTYGVTLQASPC